MRAIVYSEAGGSEVLRLVERPEPEPGPGEVRVRIHVSGVNPTDWKARRRGPAWQSPEAREVVPNQDGAGVVDAVGEGVDPGRIGERVWVWEAAWQRAHGTAQELVCLPSRQAVRLPDEASFELGASLGIPALTAHRCLTVHEGGPSALTPGALAGTTVLVAGGAGAVGHAAIQLARWAGAHVLATVSSDEKARLARAAGAEHVVRYRSEDAAQQVLARAPGGVNVVVEVAPAANAALDAAVVAPCATVAVYAVDGGAELPISWSLMQRNVAYRFVLVYTVPAEAKDRAVADVSAAVADGALAVGEEAGLPLHRYPLERTGDAHDAVEAGAVGKVVIDLTR
ncbi:MAG TPA: NADPH:quinone reductase [Gaiellaceae bacterium]|nr:NADPH:quinone reductase [Gaiellaceae bacterium]